MQMTMEISMYPLQAWSSETHGRAVFVTKFIPDYDPR